MQLEEEKAEKEKKKHRGRRNKEKGVAIAREKIGRKGKIKGERWNWRLKTRGYKREREAREGRDLPVTSRLRSHTCVRLKSATYLASRHMLQKAEATRVYSLGDTLDTIHSSRIDNFFRDVFLTLRFPCSVSLSSIDMTRGLMHVAP